MNGRDGRARERREKENNGGHRCALCDEAGAVMEGWRPTHPSVSWKLTFTFFAEPRSSEKTSKVEHKRSPAVTGAAPRFPQQSSERPLLTPPFHGPPESRKAHQPGRALSPRTFAQFGESILSHQFIQHQLMFGAAAHGSGNVDFYIRIVDFF